MQKAARLDSTRPTITFSQPVLMQPLIGSQPVRIAESDADPARGAPVIRRARSGGLPWFWMAVASSMRRVLMTAATVALATTAPPVISAEQPVLSREQRRLATAIARKRFYIVVLEEKGGVGKSLMLQIAYEVVAGPGRKVLVIDADETNENMKRLGLASDENIVQAQRVDFEGFLFIAARQLVDGDVDAVLIDSAAGDEKYFQQHLPEIASDLRVAGARLIVIRPVTTNPINLDNLVSFGRKTMTQDMGVLMVKNHGQGRTDQDFAIWMASPERQEMLAKGMEEVSLENAGALCSDLATELGITIAHVALIDPKDLKIAESKRHIATKYFNERFRMFVARWLMRQVDRFQNGFERALSRTV